MMAEPVRVLWVVKGLGPGGAEHLLAAAARTHDHARFHVECAYVLPWKDHLVADLEAAGVRTHCLSSTRRDLRWPLRLSRLVRSGHWDVVHVHSPLPGSVARLATRSLPKESRPRLVTTEHNRWETHRLPTRLANRLTSRWDAATIAVTEEVRASMRGRAARHATSVRHGIDVVGVAGARAQRAAVRAELGLGDDEVVIGTVANFRPQKDYPNLLQAARLLVDRGVAARIVAVGQGPDEAAIRALRSDLGLDDTVILTGFRADAREVMAACDVFTLASQWEGLPVAIMEALALGLPVVATAVGGIAEELHDDVDAVLVPPRDAEALAAALERVVLDAALRDRLGRAARQRAQEFDVGRAVQVLEEIYSRGQGNGHVVEASGDADEPPTATPRRSKSAGLDLRAATPDDRPAIMAVLSRSLGADGDDPRYQALFAWKHDENPFGPSPMWVATDAGRVVAFRTFMRWEFVRGGRVLRAMRAVDTATDPDYQGRGLFTALTLLALEEVRAEGVDFVFNTPNSQSRPGYLKMGWREVGNLSATLHVSSPTRVAKVLRSKVAADRWSQSLTVGEAFTEWLDRSADLSVVRLAAHATADVRELRTRADERFLAWRFGTPLLGYRAVHDGDEGTTAVVRARRRGSATELAFVTGWGERRHLDRLASRTAKQVGADYVMRLGAADALTGYVPVPGGGPMLTWRAVNDPGMPPRSNWNLTLGDIELF
jgi:glycosyltransferase involved in cell wall biosynthesis/predicted N-acetyltransferase YhbS